MVGDDWIVNYGGAGGLDTCSLSSRAEWFYSNVCVCECFQRPEIAFGSGSESFTFHVSRQDYVTESDFHVDSIGRRASADR